MIPAPIPTNEAARQASLNRMNLVSTAREPDIDRVVRLARRAFGTEIALLSLIDNERQWFKSRYGLDATETGRDISFCGHAIMTADALVVKDTYEDQRFHDNPLVTDGPKIRFYAGQPLMNADGFNIGTLCLISPSPRDFSDDEKEVLGDFARLLEIVLENRKLHASRDEILEALQAAERDKLLDALTGVWNRRGMEQLFDRELVRCRRENASLAVAMVDIDHFKRINDSFGHQTGDEAIKLTAELLTDAARGSDIVARFGGEEFFVILPGLRAEALQTIGDKILAAFRTRARLATGQVPYSFTASVGLTIGYPEKKNLFHRDLLLEMADKALYEAKAGGRDRWVIKNA